jgi:hypothetical protein
LHVFTAPGHYHTDVGNLAYESAKRFKDKISVYLDLPLMSDIMSPEVECTLTDEHKITNEAKSAVYHAVFKSRVDRFPKILKDVSHKNFMHSCITILCIPFITRLIRS